MIDVNRIKKGKYHFHTGLGELVFDKDATAELLGCSKDNLVKIRGKGGLNPLKNRWHRATVYAQSDIEQHLSRRA